MASMGDTPAPRNREKAHPPPGAEVVAIDDSEEDSDMEFFMAKPVRRAVRKKAPPPRRKQASPVRPSVLAEGLPSDSDEDSDAERRRKKRKAKARAKQPSLPEWTRSRASQSVERGRSSTAGRESPAPISLLSDDEPATPKLDKGKGRETTKRRRINVTPPPPLAEEEIASIEAESLRLFKEVGIVIDHEGEAGDARSSSPARDRSGPEVQIMVQMVADPDKRALEGRAAAVSTYERKRTFKLYQSDPVSKLLQVLADRVQVPSDQLLLVHEGQRIFDTSETPRDLGISFAGELKAYELRVYEKIQRAERRARLALFSDGAAPAEDEDKDHAGEPSRRSPSPQAAPSAPAGQKVKLHLRGPGGELHFSAAPTTSVAAMLRYYCTKHGIEASEVPRYRLEFDGEPFDGAATVADMDVESGDLIDVSYR